MSSFDPNATIATYQLDLRHSSTSAAWEAMGKPVYPSRAQLATLRQSAQLAPIRITRLSAEALTVGRDGLVLRYALELPALHLSHICSFALVSKVPPRPEHLTLRTFDATSDTDATVVLSWQVGVGQHSCIRSYVVQHAVNAGAYSRANTEDFIFESFTHRQQAQVAQGCYRVAAVDYWGQVGSVASECIP